MITEQIDLTRRMDERFKAETTWSVAMSYDEPVWYRRLLSALVLVVGDSEIRYFSSTYAVTKGEDTSLVDVVVLTDEIIAYAAFSSDPQAPELQLNVVALARRSLTGFGVAVSDDEDLTISVSYPGFDKTLPLGSSDWPHRETETFNLIECLRQDLVS
ncbi:hypothetical protein [Subtercola boreus]|uniref:Uncharacterized protein n=1 Tax=Subtercola boreus TaxID=120213 RepID=A0A3E0W8K6_9MICO|nr:hypothetical protein [Subtercola boreus]RFA18133.1 hypothetical protein B7R24_15930 [Subtercola boreus]RFA18515.1 hypothetical protein B7R23_15965 [Subtercola boreus]RFA25043.1 hypothetical protein B7R25_15960 [Subtercola boreus]